MRIKNSERIFELTILGILTLWALAILYPFYNTVLVSLVPEEVYIKTPFMLIPKQITLDSYLFVFNSKALLSGMRVTLIIVIFGVTYSMLLTVGAAYALSKPIPGKNIFILLIIVTMYFEGGLVPFYLWFKKLGLMDSYLAMILPGGVQVSYFMIIKRYFGNIPRELEESAKMDGANEITILWKIILPISLPILATFLLYYSVHRWNEWWHGMLFIRSIGKVPLQTVLRSIVQDANTMDFQERSSATIYSDGVKMASIIVTMFPVMCLYPFLQKFFVKGLLVGAVKA